MEQKTHLKINKSLSGEPIELREGYSRVQLKASLDMVLDDTGLIHGGFTFGLADFAAMIAINHPNTVLGGAEVRFIEPVKKGDTLIAEAHLIKKEGKKLIVDVNIKRDSEIVFIGQFICFAPEKHVLDFE